MCSKILSDEGKRRQYDQMLNNPTGFGAGSSHGTGPTGAQWTGQEFHGSIDPEELFRKIFGDFNFGGGGGKAGFRFEDGETAETQFGYGASQEV